MPNPTVGDYVLFPWFEEHGIHHIHPDDIKGIRDNHPYGKVFRRVGSDGKYTLLNYGQETIRVLPDLVQELPVNASSCFSVGDCVRLASDGKSATVASVTWHGKRSEPFYSLNFDGKPKSRRYWNNDLRTQEAE